MARVLTENQAAAGMGLLPNVDPVQACVTSSNMIRSTLKAIIVETPREHSYKMLEIFNRGIGCIIGGTHV